MKKKVAAMDLLFEWVRSSEAAEEGVTSIAGTHSQMGSMRKNTGGILISESTAASGTQAGQDLSVLSCILPVYPSGM